MPRARIEEEVVTVQSDQEGRGDFRELRLSIQSIKEIFGISQAQFTAADPKVEGMERTSHCCDLPRLFLKFDTVRADTKKPPAGF